MRGDGVGGERVPRRGGRWLGGALLPRRTGGGIVAAQEYETNSHKLRLITRVLSGPLRLALDAFFAARLVVDTGMNYFGWSRERGMAYMKEHTVESDVQIDEVIGSGSLPLFLLQRHMERWIAARRAAVAG